MSDRSSRDELEDEAATPPPVKPAKLTEAKAEKIDDIEPESHIDHAIGSTMNNGDTFKSPKGVYKIVEKLGEGGFGKVYLTEYTAKNASNSEQVALKEISLHGMNEKKKEECEKEAKLMKRISESSTNQHIVKYLDSFMTPSHDSLFIAMNYCSRGDLNSKIKENISSKEKFDPEIVYDYIYQIADGINELHFKYNIVHRDLKPANILIAWENGKEVLKISDFGLVKVLNSLDKSQSHSKKCGTLFYMSPEQREGIRCRFPVVDIWAIGIIFYELCIVPKKLDDDEIDDEMEDLREKVRNNQRVNLPSQYSAGDTKWLNKMISKDSSRRMSARQVRNKAKGKSLKMSNEFKGAVEMKYIKAWNIGRLHSAYYGQTSVGQRYALVVTSSQPFSNTSAASTGIWKQLKNKWRDGKIK